MGGMFGGFLGLLEIIGWKCQYMLRVITALLIGSAAWKWDLTALPRDHQEFRIQRGIREAIGTALVAFGVAVLGNILSDGSMSKFGWSTLPFFFGGIGWGMISSLRNDLEN